MDTQERLPQSRLNGQEQKSSRAMSSPCQLYAIYTYGWPIAEDSGRATLLRQFSKSAFDARDLIFVSHTLNPTRTLEGATQTELPRLPLTDTQGHSDVAQLRPIWYQAASRLSSRF